MHSWLTLVWIGIGGACGAVSRFGIAQMLPVDTKAISLGALPLGTLVANLTGCFLMGVLLGSGWAENNAAAKYGMGVGFLGSLTTFSTFSSELYLQLSFQRWLIAAGYLSMSVFAGVLLVFLGMTLASQFRAK